MCTGRFSGTEFSSNEVAFVFGSRTSSSTTLLLLSLLKRYSSFKKMALLKPIGP